MNDKLKVKRDEAANTYANIENYDNEFEAFQSGFNYAVELLSGSQDGKNNSEAEKGLLYLLENIKNQCCDKMMSIQIKEALNNYHRLKGDLK